MGFTAAVFGVIVLKIFPLLCVCSKYYLEIHLSVSLVLLSPLYTRCCELVTKTRARWPNVNIGKPQLNGIHSLYSHFCLVLSIVLSLLSNAGFFPFV